MDRRAVLHRDDDARELRRFLDPAFDAHQLLGRAARDRTGWQVLIGRLNRGDHLIDADPPGFERIRLQEDLHLTLGLAVDVDAADAEHILQALDHHLIDQGRDFPQ